MRLISHITCFLLALTQAQKRNLEVAKRTSGTLHLSATFLIKWERLQSYGIAAGWDIGFFRTLSQVPRIGQKKVQSAVATPTITSLGKTH